MRAGSQNKPPAFVVFTCHLGVRRNWWRKAAQPLNYALDLETKESPASSAQLVPVSPLVR
jgi:hypothetical protein